MPRNGGAIPDDSNVFEIWGQRDWNPFNRPWEPISAGHVWLEEGPNVILFRPYELGGGYFMDVYGIHLFPIDAPNWEQTPHWTAPIMN